MKRVGLLMAALAFALLGTSCGPTIGDACTTANQCGIGVCLTADFAPGGACSLSCSATTTCPNGSTCINSALGPGAPGCMRSCTKASDCRAGYLCATDTISGAQYCVGPAGI